MTARRKRNKENNEFNKIRLLYAVSQILDRSLDLREVPGPIFVAISKHTGLVCGTLGLRV